MTKIREDLGIDERGRVQTFWPNPTQPSIEFTQSDQTHNVFRTDMTRSNPTKTKASNADML